MEQPSRRNKFIKSLFNKVNNEMYLSNEMLEELYDDINNPCKELMPALKELAHIEGKKCFLLLKYTEDREPVSYLAKFLRKHNQGHVAEDLEKFNKSEEFIDYVTTEFLSVRQTDLLRSGGSCRFVMDASPRGFCLIILNEINLEPEAKQLASVFSQMYFTIRIETKKTVKQIETIFGEVANDNKYKDHNALVTIVIGHGGAGLFFGSNVDKTPGDNVPIPKLIDQFSEDKCSNFNGKPKINIFNCCRGRKYDEILNLSQDSSTLLEKITTFKKDWVNNNINTTVIYSCSEGQKSFYSTGTGFSFFGRALSHTIAQYACEQNLDQLIKTVNKRLEKDEIDAKINKQYPEVIHYKSRWALYFNPGRIKIN